MKTALAVLLTTLTLVGCGANTEGTLLTQFFAASRLRDLTALRNVSTVVFEPATDGIVTSYEITSVTDRGSTKEVLITAPVKMFDGRMVTKTFTVTIDGGLVTAISERPAPSPIEGAASPSTPRR
jgi:hypothetical protein